MIGRYSGVASRVGLRLLGSIVVVFGVVTATFILARIVSPDPTNLYVASDADEATRDIVRARLGLNESVPAQYVKFVNQLLHGDLGTAFSTGQPVSHDLMRKLPATLELATYAVIGGAILGILVGVIAAVWQGSIADRVIRFVTVSGLALPHFWVGLMLLWIFFVVMGVAPGPVGRLPIGLSPPETITGFYVVDAVLEGNLPLAWTAVRQLILPTITLGSGVFAPIARTVRSTMIETLQADYIRTSFAMGIRHSKIYVRYALRNVMLPVLTMLAGAVAFVFSGSVLVEGVFGWPGVGEYAFQATEQPDFPAIQGFVLYAAVLYVLIYLVLDLVYIRIDPRVRL
jgi:peptide/nickel transport system permease protein